MAGPITITTTPQSYRVPVTSSGILTGTDLSLTAYVSRFIEHEFNPVLRTWIVARKYRYYNTKTRELYLPAYDLPRFRAFLLEAGVSWVEHPLPLTSGMPVEIPLRPGVAPRDALQAQAIDYIATDAAPVRGLALQTGKGKALPLSTKVKTPGGWTRMGDLRLGDRVTAADGTPTEVVGIYPQGVTPTYRIEMEDGRGVPACAQHLWKVMIPDHMSPEARTGCVVTTATISATLSLSKMAVFLPLCLPEPCAPKDLPIDPYAVGYLLGEGPLPRLGVDETLMQRFILGDLYKSVPGLLTCVPSHTALSGQVYEKCLPICYLSASPDQKRALVQGLMDSSGMVESDGSLVFHGPGLVLCEQLRTVIWSLGGIASCSLTRRDDKLIWEVRIKMPTPSQLFRDVRKRSQAAAWDATYRTLKLRVVSVEQEQEQETQCISVAHPEALYVVEHHIVTHNTASLLMGLSRIGKRSLIVLPGFIEQWQRAIDQFTLLSTKDVYLVQGQQSVFKLMAGIDKTIFPKVILGSIGTLRNYCLDKESFVNCPSFDLLCERWQIGVRATDEIHLNFHANLMMDLRLTPAVTVCLTATFDNSKSTIKAIFDGHYPVTMRYGEDTYHRYVEIYAVAYRTGVGDIPVWAYKGEKGYSHIKWEAWLLTKGRTKLRQITESVYMPLVWAHYMHRRQEGEKCLILCDTTDMCRFFLRECQHNFPDLRSAIYIGETEDVVLDESDLIISTLKSAGTARDIKNLLTVLVTSSVRSDPLNKQMLGRLRVLPNRDPQFVYTANLSIPNHVMHAQERAVLFRPLAKTFVELTM